MLYFHDIIGYEQTKEQLRQTAQRGIIPHAQLFVGADGSGALALALTYARYLNCTNRTEDEPCGHCPSCQRYAAVGDPNLHFLYPIINAGGKNLCEDYLPQWRSFIQQGAYMRYEEWLAALGGDGKKASIFTREGEWLQHIMAYQPSGRGYRVLVIWLPERMQEALGNKILKLVEEPPERTVILMVSADESSVLGTLRSRMQSVRLRPLSEAEILEGLQREEPPQGQPDALLVAHLSEGNYRRALDLYQGNTESLAEEFSYLQQLLRATVNAQPLEMKVLADKLAALSRDEQATLIEYLARMFREFYLFNLDLPEINYLTTKEQGIATYIRGCVDGQNIRQIQGELDLAQQHLRQNVNAKMVFFDLTLRLTRLLASGYKRVGVR